MERNDSKDEVSSQALTQPIARGLSLEWEEYAAREDYEDYAAQEAVVAEKEEEYKVGGLPRMVSTTEKLPNETEMETAKRALSNTSDDASNPGLDRTYCLWKDYSLLLTANLAMHSMLAEFVEMPDHEQERCTPPGLPVYGDLCTQHASCLLGLEVRPSTQRRGGMGLWTVWDRRKKEVICLYKGNLRVVSDGESMAGPHRGKYAIDMPQDVVEADPKAALDLKNLVIDATRTTDGFARYINDFSLGQPSRQHVHNCLFRPGEDCTPPLDKHMVFVEAKCKIRANTELSVSYGDNYWTNAMRRSEHTFPCFRCRHTVVCSIS